MGVPELFFEMFVRKKKNKLGNACIQIISKVNGKYTVASSLGSAFDEQGIQKLWYLGKQEMERLSLQSKPFVSENDILVEQIFEAWNNASVKTVGSEIVFGRISDHTGFNVVEESLFRHLVIARLAFPLSKLKTVEYLHRF